MSLRNKIQLAAGALTLGQGLSGKLALLRLCARHGRLLQFSEEEASVRLRRPPGTTLHYRDTGADAVLMVEVLFFEDYAPLKRLRIQPRHLLDIGANIGLGSLYLRRLYPQAKLDGLEPAPAEADLCAKNYASWGGATLHRCAAGAEDGKDVEFAVNADRTGGQHLAEAGDETGWQKMKVTMRRVDAMIDAGELPPPDLVKMDIEGAEAAALEGFGRYLSHPQAYILETHSPELHQACRDKLTAAGYRVASDLPRPGVARILCMSRDENTAHAETAS